jgi:flagellar M-ring protein FliF
MAQAKGFGELPVIRQLGLMLGLAASVALGVAVVLWSRTPDYSLLYGRLADTEVALIAETLEKAAIDYRIEHASGAILVPSSKVHEARLKLASSGLPNSSGTGFELLENNNGFGTSRFMERARYNRALEGELARSISTLQSVESARVHLAIPKRSVFVRDKVRPRASVVLNLYSGTSLEESRLAGIVHLVASSVPELEADQVTVVDQKGRLLTDSQGYREVALSASQLSYTGRLESHYMKRVLEILAPVTGAEGVRAQVVADVDFTIVEKTTEDYEPESRSVRSEDTFEEQTSGAGAGAAGIPGALSNQPPGTGRTREVDAQDGGENEASTGRTTSPINSTRRATRNYELDHSISHSRSAPGGVKRLSVAVVVDYKTVTDEAGQQQRVPRDAEEMERITALVKEAVGFSEARNDSVNVTNISFMGAVEPEPLPEIPLWQQPWVAGLVKQAVGGILVIFLVLGVLRPVLRSLAAIPATAGPAGAAGNALPAGASAEQMALADDTVTLGGQLPAAAGNPAQQTGMARNMIENDPDRVASVMSNWMSDDG